VESKKVIDGGNEGASKIQSSGGDGFVVTPKMIASVRTDDSAPNRQ